MLLKDIHDKGHFSFHESAADWREAIRMSCQPMEADGTTDARYAQAMIDCVEKHGPYIVILPGVAMPHSTENAEGAFDTTIGFMRLEKPVSFEEGNPEKDASLFFTLVSTNADEHMENMQRLYTVLTNEAVLEELKKATSAEDLLRIDAMLE